ncbi:MAG TPA: TraM recognition domain-containing protein [Candidatus Saccharimonadales bacterium]|nr:TraM recognition domain-containing protein [Candidatus Saccharimonadales bacterium]
MQHLTSVMQSLPWIGLGLACLVLLTLFLAILLRLITLRNLLKKPVVYIEVTPPPAADRTQQSTQQLFSILHGIGSRRTIHERLRRHQVTLSLEVISTKESGVRYIIRVGEQEARALQGILATYLPSARVRRLDDYLSANLDFRTARVITFKQRGAYAFPLKQQPPLDEHDPIAYLTSSIADLSKDEQIVLQLVLTPTSIRDAVVVSKKILSNEDLLSHLSCRKRMTIAQKGFGVLGRALSFAFEAVTELLHDSSRRPASVAAKDTLDKQQVAMRLKPARSISSFEQELMNSVQTKVSQPLYYAEFRALLVVSSQQAARLRTRTLTAPIASFDTNYQSLRARPSFPRWIKGRYRLFLFKNRLPSFFKHNSNVFAASELADLYHFPHSQTNQASGVVKSLSPTLPAPLNIKRLADGAGFDVIIGQNEHHGIITPIGLIEQERERHKYVIGGTGNGKTTMLQYEIVQDMQSGKGLAVVDPHGDMAETMLQHVPPNRVKDVVYFNPDDLEHPIGLNLLELTPGLSGNELLREKDIITESVVSVFRKIFSEDDSGGHRIEYVLRNTIHTALTVEGATLFTVLKLLQNATFRKSITDKLEDEDLKDFWKNELGQAGNMQRVKMSAGITAKIGRFNSNAAAKFILGQKKSTVDFEDIINSGKILICNFSKGLLGEDVSELFGITVLAKLQLASLRRARLRRQERRAFFLYVDEFQNFATPSFVQMLSESRKYRLFMTMAEQSTSQQKDQQMLGIILANVGTVVCFRTGNPQDERLLLPLFSPYVGPGEIANLPSFNFYAKLSAVHTQEPLSGSTLLLADKGNENIAHEVILYSRRHYAGKAESGPETPKELSKPTTSAKPKETTSKTKKETKIPGGR